MNESDGGGFRSRPSPIDPTQQGHGLVARQIYRFLFGHEVAQTAQTIQGSGAGCGNMTRTRWSGQRVWQQPSDEQHDRGLHPSRSA